MTSITVPEQYGYVVLAVCVLPMFASMGMGYIVMQARTSFDVPYPNLYATPGVHVQADEFNRVQRGHQSMLETLTSLTALGLVGGLKHPIVAICAGILFTLGSYLFMLGYADITLDAATARYQKGGPLKMVGLFLALGSAISMVGTLSSWW